MKTHETRSIQPLISTQKWIFGARAGIFAAGLLLLALPVNSLSGSAEESSLEGPTVVRFVPLEDGSGRLAERSQSKSARLFMPFLSAKSASGVVSLFALRNTSNSTISVSLLLMLADGSNLVASPVPTIAGKATLTINVGDLDLPVDADLGAVVGMGDFAVVDTVTGLPVDNDALVGDYFFVDPTNNFATGDPLVETTQLCNRINTRFADGGVFDGSTFTIGAADFEPSQGNGVLATATIFDEAGQNLGGFTLEPEKRIISITTAELAAANITLPTFGSIEWILSNNLQGFATWAMNAGGKFSVGMNGSCIE